MKFLSILFGGLAIVVAYGMYLEWDVTRWDAKIDALCAANGGKDVATRVYETAVAPETKEYFRGVKPNQSLGVIERRAGVDYGPRYPYVIETRIVEILNDKNPSVAKYSARLVRAADNKTLADRVGYQRSGGGLPLWTPDEIRTCPVDRIEERLEFQVFTNHPKRQSGGSK